MPGHKSSKPYGGLQASPSNQKFLNTTGNPTLGVGLCSRCQFKFALHLLREDPNIPGFMVCAADRDDFDPYRMPARPSDIIQLPFVRPDTALVVPDDEQVPIGEE